MLLQSFDYLTHRFNNRIVMTLLVKNEADIIESNIKFHRALGVDAFVVMDNNSSDGTREILEKLQHSVEIIIIDEECLYHQKKWMFSLAGIAKRKLGADWVISNDADEFWLPDDDLSIKEVLSFKGHVLVCNKYNMVLSEGLTHFFDSVFRVESPVLYEKNKQQQQRDGVSMVLAKVSPKVIVNPHGLLFISGGNHRAIHISNLSPDSTKRFGKISVYHYPFRSYQQFEQNIINRKMLLESGQRISMGVHYKRWVKLYNEGLLKEEFEKNLVLCNTDIEILKKYDIIREDYYPKIKIKSLSGFTS